MDYNATLSFSEYNKLQKLCFREDNMTGKSSDKKEKPQ